MMLRRVGWLLAVAWLASTGAVAAQSAIGPYDVVLTVGGDGLIKPVGTIAIAEAAAAKSASAPITATLPVTGDWTQQVWVEPAAVPAGKVLVAGVGYPAEGRYFMLHDGVPALVTPAGTIAARARLTAGRWHHLAATARDGTARLFVDGREVGRGRVASGTLRAVAGFGPRVAGDPAFSGRIAGFGSTPALTSAALASAARTLPEAALIQFEAASPAWPVQIKQMAGQVAPQPVATLPRSTAQPSKPVAKPEPHGQVLAARGSGLWAIGGWRLAAAPGVTAGGAALSRPGFDARRWYAATVPGTVLTTLVDRGVYPDPAYGLNNLAIPESLNQQDYWYRTEFEVPASAAGRRLRLDFNGVNYAAEVWVNAAKLGTMKGAFIRGRFELPALTAGRTAVAVRVSPTPNPGLAHEESLTSGVGENGGMSMLDGPTFGAAEGWDWIPSIRDRNTGLWQGVDLVATGDVQIGDPQVVTALRDANSVADVEITVPVRNLSDRAVTAEVRAAFDDVAVVKRVALAARGSVDVRLAPAEFAQLAVRNPKLWWPNGYGDAALHELKLAVAVDGQASDTRELRFGMRQVTYEMSLVDRAGALRRVGLDLTRARTLGQRVVDGTHQSIRKVPGGWAASLVPGAETSPAVTPIAGDAGLSPHLVIRVNGVRIAARGGNIGMDDFMKRTERSRLEPFFRLHRDAHLNVIRNWVGQNTEAVFFDLADEYGLMVLNDFWSSTQDYNIEPQDVALFAANAADTIRRFRNHPSIVLWFGRNEGVPQPILNAALEDLVAANDGTRIYMGSSNRVNLQNSGPYNWRPPVEYFTEHAKGFSVELGTPSFPTIESWQRAMPKADLWPISDTWAYHDWHQTGNGAVTTYMAALAARFGAGTSLADFERKAQMMQYESYRAIFEGLNAGLWRTTSGRMLWMTQPAWPSSAWQIFSSDYDTHGAFYGVKKASTAVHVQMNLPDHKVIVVNNTQAPLAGIQVRARVTSLDNKPLAERTATVAAAPGSTADAFTLDLAPLLGNGMVLVALEISDASGARLGENLYWQGDNEASYRGLNTMPPAKLSAKAASRRDGAEVVTTVNLVNRATVAALATKLTMVNADGSQVLPAYFSDNYVSLLPGTTRRIEVRTPRTAVKGNTKITLRGWNVVPVSVAVRGD